MNKSVFASSDCSLSRCLPLFAYYMRLLISGACEGVWECGVEAHSPSNAAVCFATGRSDRQRASNYTHAHTYTCAGSLFCLEKEQQDVRKVRRIEHMAMCVLCFSCLVFVVLWGQSPQLVWFMNDQWLIVCSYKDSTGEVWESHSAAWFVLCHTSALRLAAAVVMAENLFRPLCLTPALSLTNRFTVILMWF